MKAIEKLIQLRKEDPSIVAIAKDKNGEVFFYKTYIPKFYHEYWQNAIGCDDNELFDVEFDSENWQECIVTVNDLENYEVKMMSISVQEYERLLDAEKKLKEIQKFFV